MVVTLLAALLVAAPPAGQSVGAPWEGKLVDGTAMPLKGPDHHFTRNVKKKGSNYGTQQMVRLLRRAAHFSSLKEAPMVMGSISKRHGGKMNPHKSHQAGRDVDILFYARDAQGRPTAMRGFYEYDDQGRCKHDQCKGWTFDTKLNWWLVRTLVWSELPQVQYIFVSNGLKKRMLDYAKRRGEHPEILRRAKKVLSQPRNSSPHADHFHVRIYCTPKEHKHGCTNGGRIWDWVKTPKG